MRYTNARRRSSATTSATPRISTGCSPASTRSTALRHDDVAVQGRRARRPRRRDARDRSVRARAGERAARQPGGPDASARDPTLQHPRCVFQLLKRHFARYTPEMVEETCGVPRATVLPASPRRCATTRAASARPRSATRSAGRSTPSACSTSAPRRSCSCCSATSVGPAAASWRCAATRRSRARPTSRRSTTSSPATSRCRAPSTTDLDDVHRAERRRRRASGASMDAYTVSLLKAWWGDAATADNDFCFDYLPRITGDHSHYQTALDMLDGTVHGFFVMGENPAVGSANGKLQRLAMRRSSTGSSCATSRRSRPRSSGTTRPRSRPASCAPDDRHRGVLHARGRAHREGRQLHEHAAPAAVAPQGRRAAGRLPLRAVVHVPPRAA